MVLDTKIKISIEVALWVPMKMKMRAQMI